MLSHINSIMPHTPLYTLYGSGEGRHHSKLEATAQKGPDNKKYMIKPIAKGDNTGNLASQQNNSHSYCLEKSLKSYVLAKKMNGSDPDRNMALRDQAYLNVAMLDENGRGALAPGEFVDFDLK